MTDHIKLLEELVVEAVDRLRSLSRERDEARDEIESLRGLLKAAEREARTNRDEEAERAGEARHEEARIVLREALSELRDEKSVV